jgi:hypothetical protein
MTSWRIDYDNDTGPGDEGFSESWTVTDGSRSFTTSKQQDAAWLHQRLSSMLTGDVVLREENVYGAPLLYPANDLARALCEIRHSKTFTEPMVRHCKAMGLRVVLQGIQKEL